MARMKERRGAHRDLVGKPEGRRPFGRSRRRWEDRIKMDLQEIRCGPGLAAFMNRAMNLCSVKCIEFLEWLRKYWLIKKDSAVWC